MTYPDETTQKYAAEDIPWLGHKIGAWKLAAHYDGLYYAFIDGLLDCDIKPSKYAKVTIRRIKAAWAMTFILEPKSKWGTRHD